MRLVACWIIALALASAALADSSGQVRLEGLDATSLPASGAKLRLTALRAHGTQEVAELKLTPAP